MMTSTEADVLRVELARTRRERDALRGERDKAVWERDRLRAALEIVGGRLDYLQNLWGKEGVTERVAQTIRNALVTTTD